MIFFFSFKLVAVRARGCACLSLLFSCSCSWLSLGTGCSCFGWGETGVTGGPACSMCLSVCLSVHLFFPSMFLGGRARLALPVRRLRSWGSAVSGTARAAAVSSRPCRALLGLLAAGSQPLRTPKLGPCVCVRVCVCARAGMCTSGKGACSGWRWVKLAALSSNFCH